MRSANQRLVASILGTVCLTLGCGAANGEEVSNTEQQLGFRGGRGHAVPEPSHEPRR